MKIAFNQATTMKHSTLELDLAYCEKHGYDGIEIRLDKLKDYLRRHRPQELKAFFERSALRPLAFNALEQISFRDEESFRQIVNDLKLGEIGGIIGCRTVIVVPAFDVGDYTKQAIRDETVRALRQLADLARPYGLRLAFEFVGYPNCSVNTFGQAYDIVREAERDNVGIVLDCFHFHAMNSRLEDLRQADPADIFVFHIDDCEDLPAGALRDRHRVWPGQGCIDLDAILRTLKEIGYGEMASVELFRPEYWEWDIERAIRTGYETASRVIRSYFPPVKA